MKRVCTQCGHEFELTEKEITFYQENSLNLPTRCKECRQVNKGKASDKRSGHAAANSSEAALLKARAVEHGAAGKQGIAGEVEGAEGAGPMPGWTRRKLIVTFILMVVVLIVCFGGTYLVLRLQ